MNDKNGKPKTNEPPALNNKDILFQERLEQFDKATLAIWICLGVDAEESREWLTGYLEDLEDLLGTEGVLDAEGMLKPSLVDLILAAVKQEIADHQAAFGDANLNPRRLDEWTHGIFNLAGDAEHMAQFGQDMTALNTLLYVIREAVRCLEYFIDKGAEIGAASLDDAIKKATGDAYPSPAAKANQSQKS